MRNTRRFPALLIKDVLKLDVRFNVVASYHHTLVFELEVWISVS
jgi:hypothetical protein